MIYKYKHGATVGRYRPYHNGHNFLHNKMLQDCEKITVLIGSAQEEDTLKNPFSVQEVEQMIRNCHPSNLDRIEIMPIKDINDPPNWRQHVLDTIGKKIDAYYCGSIQDAECFINQDDFDTVIIDRIVASDEHGFKSGTEIREMMFANNSECLKYVHEDNAKYLRRMIVPGQG